MRRRPRVERTRRGDFRLHLPPEERALLRTLPAQLRDLLSSDDPARERLFPPASLDDRELNESYQAMVHDDLVRQRMSALELMESTLDAERMDEDHLTSWLLVLNDLRLVLGSRLGVTEDLYEEGIPEDDVRHPAWTLYQYLGWLEEQVVEALAEGLDPAGTEPD